jgi:Kef-type K+ transport system membrane component KefB/nucleotide-binding universal stress UspA family protein
MPEPTVLRGLEHHALLLLLVQLAVLLCVARVLGEILRKLGQPPVVGELAAGVVLGPSVFGALWPELHRWVFPPSQAQSDLLSVVSWIGVLFLLVVTGLETDLDLIRRKGRSALLVSLGGIIVPFGTGILFGWMAPDRYLVQADQRLVFSLFMAVAMSISAVPVIAKVLLDMKLIRRDIGQLTLAAGMTDDTIGWILLSVVASLATRGEVDPWTVTRSVVVAVLLVGLGLTVGRRAIGWIVGLVDRHVGGGDAQLSLLIVLAFGAAAFTHEMGVEAVLGAFVIGILFGQAPRFRRDVGHVLESVTAGFVAPIFFAAAGLKVNLLRLAEPEIALMGLVVLAIACVGKFAGAYVGAGAAGIPHWGRLALGSAMNARGAMEIVVATVGLGLGVLTIEMYSIVVMVAIVTSLMAPPLLRLTLSRVAMGTDEAERLERERVTAESFFGGVKRMLLMAGPSKSSALAARIASLLAKRSGAEVTVLSTSAPESERADPEGVRRRSLAREESLRELVSTVRAAALSVAVRRRSGGAEQILKEAGQADLIVAGAPTRSGTVSRFLFGRQLDPVVASAQRPVIIVDEAGGGDRLRDERTPERIVVPTVGTEHSRRALEVACSIRGEGAPLVTLVHVIEQESADHYLLDRQETSQSETIALEMINHQADIARQLGADVEITVLEASRPDEAILAYVESIGADLLVLGSQRRPAGERAFLGRCVEAVTTSAPCPVVIVVT